MGQVTIYLDAKTEKKLERAVTASGISRSKWIARLIEKRLSDEWPDGVAELAGQWKDFPSAEDLREDIPPDRNREKL
jgi:hypothetical protein